MVLVREGTGGGESRVFLSINLFAFLIRRYLPRAFERYFMEADETHAKMAEDRKHPETAKNSRPPVDKKADSHSVLVSSTALQARYKNCSFSRAESRWFDAGSNPILVTVVVSLCNPFVLLIKWLRYEKGLMLRILCSANY